MSQKLKFNIIFCEFDGKFGPIPKFSYPEVPKGFGMSIATKSMGFLTSEEVKDAKSVAFIPFPRYNKKGIVRNIEWLDSTLRGGIGTGSFTLIFGEADDLIYYKYIKDIESIFDAATKRIIKLKTSKVEDSLFYDELVKIHGKFLEKLKELSVQEKGMIETSEEFPKEKESEVKDTFAFKIVICGDPACGKTSTILKFTDSAFRRTYIPSIGVNITKKKVRLSNKKISLVLWDIAGQMKFRTMRSSLYEGANGILLLFDVTRNSTFKSIPNWYKDIIRTLKEKSKLVILLCGNKVDLENEREVSEKDAKTLANELQFDYFELSALTGKNIDLIFQTIAQKLIESYRKTTIE